ncbi:MAG: hypothetical protein PHF77_01250 [Candidatus Bipolaricaulis anaerobius]|nr:hypothetical protein [Candidatus Bipolaricaulis anaerobius]
MEPNDPQERFVDPVNLSEDLDRVLAALFNLGLDSDRKWWSAAEVSRMLREKHGVRVHWRTIDALLSRNLNCVDRRRRKGRHEYFLLAGGKTRIAAVCGSVTMVDPAKAVQEVVQLHQFLGALIGDIRVCDPYFDYATVEHLDACSPQCTIDILTTNVRDSGKLRRLLNVAQASGRDIHVRLLATPILHDRFIIDDRSMLILGTSLNGFGKKQCFVVRTGESMRVGMIRWFDGLWGTAKEWP